MSQNMVAAPAKRRPPRPASAPRSQQPRVFLGQGHQGRPPGHQGLPLRRVGEGDRFRARGEDGFPKPVSLRVNRRERRRQLFPCRVVVPVQASKPRGALFELRGWETAGAYLNATPDDAGWRVTPAPAGSALPDLRALMILFAAEILDSEGSLGLPLRGEPRPSED